MVINRLLEAKFFLNKMEKNEGDVFEFVCYFSAFVSAARSFTWSIRKHMSRFGGFNSFWDELVSSKLQKATARKFVEIRNFIEKEADNRISGGTGMQRNGKFQVKYFFEDDWKKDVLHWCREYYEILRQIRDIVVKKYKLDDPSSEYYWQDILELGSKT